MDSWRFLDASGMEFFSGIHQDGFASEARKRILDICRCHVFSSNIFMKMCNHIELLQGLGLIKQSQDHDDA